MAERRNPDGSLSVGILEDMDFKAAKKEKKPVKTEEIIFADDEQIIIDDDGVVIEKPVLEEPVTKPKGRPRKK